MGINKAYKSNIIKRYGTNVEVQKWSDDKPVEILPQKALLGRNTRNNVNMFKLTHQKEGIFLPTSEVRTGDYVYNPEHDEMYLVVGEHQEYDGNKKLSWLTGLMKCEHYMKVRSYEDIADDRGNIKKGYVTKFENLPCYLEFVSGNLRQLEPGLNPETEYKVYVSDVTIKEDDLVYIYSKNREYKSAVLALDYISFIDLLVMEVKRDRVRKDG